MLTFDTEVKESLNFQLVGSDKLYTIPLASYMPMKYALKFAKVATITNETERNAASVEVMMEILRQYIGDEVDEWPTQVGVDVFNRWSEANHEQGASEGE